MQLPLRRLARVAVATCLAVTGAVTVVATGTAGAQPSGRTRLSATTPSCGSSVIYKSGGTPWTCTFDDEFAGSTLDTTHWTAMNSAATGYTTGIDCYAARQVTVSSDELVLTVNRLVKPAPCLGTRISSQYLTGMVTSQNLFSQTYGRFEMRARLPAGSGLHPVFWMLPASPTHNGSYEYGEIDAAEAYGASPNYVSPHLHYVTTPGNANSGTTCYVRNTKFVDHTYALEWTSTQMTFSYDGTTCWTTTWAPAYPYAPQGATSPVPFDQPFYMMVQLAVDGPSVPFNQVSAATPLPAKMYVDYVRAWQ
jgi:beta-glucanase (GH16 family)